MHVCLGLFMIELYQKMHQNVRTISVCHLYFSKTGALHKLRRKKKKKELDSFLIPSVSQMVQQL